MKQSLRNRAHLLAVVAILALGLGGVALAHHSSSTQLNVTILDGRVTVYPTTFAAGKITLVVINRGKKAHALAIMGVGLGAKRTPTLKSGGTATLTVTTKIGMYHVWDPVTSSMTRATMLTSKAVKSSSSGSSPAGGTPTGSGMGGGTSGSGSSSGSMTGMDPNDPCAGM